MEPMSADQTVPKTARDFVARIIVNREGAAETIELRGPCRTLRAVSEMVRQ